MSVAAKIEPNPKAQILLFPFLNAEPKCDERNAYAVDRRISTDA